MEWFVILVTFAYGLFCVVWPEKARKQYLTHFDVGAPTRWYKPRTFLKFQPSPVAFRLFGVFLLGIGIFLVYLRYSRYAVSDFEH